MTVPKIVAIFIVLLIVNMAAMATGLFYQLVDGANQFGVSNYISWFIVPAAIDALLIAILSVTVQVLSPNKYVGWGIVFVWFVGTIFLNNMGYSNPLYTYARAPAVLLSDFAGQGSFWKGAAILRLYGRCSQSSCCYRARFVAPGKAPMSGACSSGIAPSKQPGFRWHSLGLRRRNGRNWSLCLLQHQSPEYYQTSDEAEKFSADYERVLKYENLPRPLRRKGALDVNCAQASAS